MKTLYMKYWHKRGTVKRKRKLSERRNKDRSSVRMVLLLKTSAVQNRVLVEQNETSNAPEQSNASDCFGRLIFMFTHGLIFMFTHGKVREAM